MILFPAIDLKNGEAVRLQQGDMARATVFNRDPAAQAQAFERQGFEYLHLVDLDGAFAGKPMNASAVERILTSVKMKVQLGGGTDINQAMDDLANFVPARLTWLLLALGAMMGCFLRAAAKGTRERFFWAAGVPVMLGRWSNSQA